MLALVIRIGASAWWQQGLETPFRFGDSETYWHLAGKLATGEPYEYGPDRFAVFRTPGYPLMLVPLFWLFGETPPVLAARVFGAFLGAATVVGLWWWTKSLFGERAGLLAAGIGAVYPGAIMTSILVLSEAPFCLALVLQLALWSSALDHETRTARLLRALGAGIFFGWGVLIRPSWLLFLPFAAGFGLCIASAKRRQIEVAAVSLATSILILTPWWIRNFVVTGHVVPTTLQTGASLYDGLNPDATGASDMQFVEDFLEDEKKDPSGEGSLEYRLNKRMTAESLTWVSENPQEAVRLAGVKFLRMWNIFPNEPSFSSLSTRLLLALTYAPVLVLGLYGAVSNFQRGYSYMLCWLPAVYFSLLHMVFIGSIRYRQPAMLGLIVLAAGTVATWIARSRKAESGHHAG